MEESIEKVERLDCMGEKHITNWLKNIPYESPVVVWDSETRSEEHAFYFGYNPQGNFHLFLRKKKNKVDIYVINDEKCWVRYWDEVSIPCLDTKYLGNLKKSERFPNGDLEKEFALKRLEKLRIK